MNTQIVDDARRVLLTKVKQARMMTESDRTLAGITMFSGVCERMKEGLRDEQPEADEKEIHSLLINRLAKLRNLERQGNYRP